MITHSEPPSPAKELGSVQRAMLPPTFGRVTACLQRDHPPEGVSNPDVLKVAVLTGPTVATMSASRIVKDEVMGVTYMDTVTTSVGNVILSGTKQKTLAQGPTIQGITDLVYK